MHRLAGEQAGGRAGYAGAGYAGAGYAGERAGQDPMPDVSRETSLATPAQPKARAGGRTI